MSAMLLVSRVRLAVAGLVVVLFLAATGCAVGAPSDVSPFLPPDAVGTPNPPPDWLSIMATGAEGEWPGTGRPPSILKGSLRELGTHDDVVYFVGMGRYGGLCLLGLVTPRSSIGTEWVMSCSSLPLLDSNALWVGFRSSEREANAYLLPDGFAGAAASLSWAEVVGENLLVVTDLDGQPNTGTPLRSTSGDTVQLMPVP